jgi:hypothetical protein
MSGYFARLAAQVNGPSMSGGLKSAEEPASLEQHVEVEAPTGMPLQEPMEGVAAPPRLLRADAVAEGAPAAAGAVDAGRAATMPGQDLPGQHLPGRETPSMPPVRADASASPGSAFTAANGEAMPDGAPAQRMAAEASNPGSRTAAASRPAAGLARDLPGDAAGNAPARPYAGFAASTARPRMADAVQPPPSRPATRPANEAAAAPRSAIRIGTITLELRPPAAPVPAPQPTPPAPAPAPQQVALRRHYLRWS